MIMRISEKETEAILHDTPHYGYYGLCILSDGWDEKLEIFPPADDIHKIKTAYNRREREVHKNAAAGKVAECGSFEYIPTSISALRIFKVPLIRRRYIDKDNNEHS